MNMSLIELKTEVFRNQENQKEGFISLVLVGTVFLERRVIITYKLLNNNRVTDLSDIISIDLLKFQFSELIKQDLEEKRIL